MKWTKEQDEILVEQIYGGASDTEIGVLLETSSAAVKGRRLKLGLKKSEMLKEKRDSDVMRFREAYCSTCEPIKDIAKRLGRAPSWFRPFIPSLRRPPECPREKRGVWIASDIHSLVQMLKDNVPVQSIADRLGKSFYSIQSKCRRMNLKIPENELFVGRQMAARRLLEGASFDRVIASKLAMARNQCRYYNRSFSATVDDIKAIFENQNGRCYYTGQELSKVAYQPNTFSIDRIDSSVGYERDNLVLTIWEINHMKWSLSNDRFIELCSQISAHSLAKRDSA